MNSAEEGEVQQHTVKGMVSDIGILTAHIQSNFIISGSNLFHLNSSENSQHVLPVKRVADVYHSELQSETIAHICNINIL